MQKIICAACAIAIAVSFNVQTVLAPEPAMEMPASEPSMELQAPNPMMGMLAPGPAMETSAPEPAEGSVEAYFEENRDTISGAAVIQIENGGITVEYCYGLIDIENNIAVDESTVFEWASITKLLTWTSVIQLVERGEIELDRDIRDYLPAGFLSRLSTDEPITMLNLMHHNAGWAEVDRNKDVNAFSPSEIIDLGAALKKFEPRQIFKPGTVVAYSNYGVALAGYIVERASGRPFWQYVNENIIDPLGMENTAVHPAQLDNPGVGEARDKEKGYDQERNFIAYHRGYDNLYPAGAAIGTIGDMAKFVIALMPPGEKGSPLFQKRETLELMLTPSLFFPDGSPENAHGFWIEWRGDKVFYGHGGNYIGFSCNLLFAPGTGEAVLVMTNTAGERVLGFGLMDKLLGPPGLPYETGGNAGKGTAKEVTGVYMLARTDVDNFHEVDFRIFDPVIVKARDNVTIELPHSGEYKQAAPYVFINEEGDILRAACKNGRVDTISAMSVDFIKRPTLQLVLDYSLFGLVILAGSFCLITLCASGLRQIVKRPRPEKCRLRAGRNIACAFYLAVAANWILFKLTSTDFTDTVPFLVINALTLPAFAAYMWFFIKTVFIKTNKTDYSKNDIRLGAITGLCLLIELIAVISFNLWR